MIDHLGINCADLAASAAFYDKVLGALGYARVMDFEVAIGYGAGKPDFWIGSSPTRAPRPAPTARSTSRSWPPTAPRCGRSSTPRWRRAPRCSTSRAIWPEYHAHYYGAFVRDPDGNNVEAVCHTVAPGMTQACLTSAP